MKAVVALIFLACLAVLAYGNPKKDHHKDDGARKSDDSPGQAGDQNGEGNGKGHHGHGQRKGHGHGKGRGHGRVGAPGQNKGNGNP